MWNESLFINNQDGEMIRGVKENRLKTVWSIVRKSSLFGGVSLAFSCVKSESKLEMSESLFWNKNAHRPVAQH